MVRLVTRVLVAGAVLAFGLSFGLGTRDLVENLVAGFYARKVLAAGKVVEIAGQQGTLAATHIILEQPDKQSVSIANTMFLDQIAKQQRMWRGHSCPRGLGADLRFRPV